MNVPTPDPRTRPPVWDRPASVLAVLMIVLVAAGLSICGAAGFGGLVRPTAWSSSHGPYGPPSCAALVSNESLNQTYAGIYDGLPNLTKNWNPGPNETAPTPQSDYPVPADGAPMLVRAWTSICGSTAFGQAYAEDGPAEFGQGYGLNGTTGDYQAFFSLTTSVPCPSDEGGSGSTCNTETSWYVDLVTGQTDGPVTRGPYVPTGFPPGPPESGSSSGPATASSSTDIAIWLFGLVSIAVILAVVVIAVRRRQRPPDGAAVVRATQDGPRSGGGVEPARPVRAPAPGTKTPPPDTAEDPLSDVY